MDSSVDLPRITVTPLIGSIYAQTWSYLAFVWLGLGTLLPFNFFITTGPYFCRQLRDSTSPNTTVSLELLYENAVTTSASFTNLITIILVTCIFIPYIHKYRIYTSLIVITICFILSLTFALISSKSWRGLFFAIIMILVMVQSICSAVLLNCFFSLASTLPSRYIQGFGSGQPLGGIFVVICSIVSITVSGKANISIAIYFGLAILVIISNIIVYFFLEKTHLFHIYSSAVREINNDHEPLFHEASSNYDDYHHTLSITSLAKRERLLVAYKHIKWQFWGAFLTFVSTFSVFPAYLSKVKSMNQINIHKHFLWPDRLYVPVMTFLLFFLGETIGRIISSKIHIPSVNYQRVLFFICLSRFLFIFLFGFCNLPKPDGYPNIFKHDAIYGVLIVIFAVSHGYCNTLNMIYAPRRVQTQLSGTVGALMMMAIALGTFIGSILSYGVVTMYGGNKPAHGLPCVG